MKTAIATKPAPKTTKTPAAKSARKPATPAANTPAIVFALEATAAPELDAHETPVDELPVIALDAADELPAADPAFEVWAAEQGDPGPVDAEAFGDPDRDPNAAPVETELDVGTVGDEQSDCAEIRRAFNPEPDAALEDAFAAAFGAREQTRADAVAVKAARKPAGPRVKPAGELPYGNAHGAKAARLAAVWAEMVATGTAPAAATPHELIQAAVSHNAAPPGGWTRGAATNVVRRYLPGFSYSAIQSAAGGVGVEIVRVDGTNAAVPKPKTSSVDPVELFRAHLATLPVAAARLLLAELAAPLVESMPAPVRDESIGRVLELD